MRSRLAGIGLSLAMAFWLSEAWAGNDFNYVTNGEFEAASAEDATIPEGWFPFFSKEKTVGLSQTMTKSGTHSLKISVQKTPEASVGVAQIIPVDAGSTYSFSVYVRNDEGDPLTKDVHGMIGIEWKNSDGKEISRTTSPEWDVSLSRLRWELRQVSEKAPKGAKTAAMVISFYDGEKGGSGSCFVDEARVEVKR